MKLSELINGLQRVLDDQGDVEVYRIDGRPFHEIVVDEKSANGKEGKWKRVLTFKFACTE